MTVLTHKYYEGQVPPSKKLTEIDKNVLSQVNTLPQKISGAIERYRFREAQTEMMGLARLGNKYLADEEPWKLIKTNPERVQTIMHTALQIASGLAILCEPFLPFTSKKLKQILNLTETDWNYFEKQTDLLQEGHKINSSELLFEKIEDEDIQRQYDKLIAAKKINAMKNQHQEITPQKETIHFEDFSKLDLRSGTIISAEKIPKADKLLQLKVDTGVDTRTIVSGIAESFSPDEILGKKVVVLINLAPRKLRGVESQGMILMGENAEGKLIFINPDDELENGAVIS